MQPPIQTKLIANRIMETTVRGQEILWRAQSLVCCAAKDTAAVGTAARGTAGHSTNEQCTASVDHDRTEINMRIHHHTVVEEEAADA